MDHRALDLDGAAVEIKVAPAEPHDLADPQSQALRGQHHGAVRLGQAGGQPPELVVGKHARLLAPLARVLAGQRPQRSIGRWPDASDDEDATIAAADNFTLNTDRLSDERRQDLGCERPPISADQQIDLSAVIHERGWQAASDAARGAVAVDLALAGVHYSEVALRINDLAGQCDRFGGRC